MQVITISGKLLGDSETKVDKSGHKYIRFKVLSEYTAQKQDKTMIFRCYCYNTVYENLKDGEKVFLSGDIDMTIRIDEKGKAWINCDVYVRQIDKGTKI